MPTRSVRMAERVRVGTRGSRLARAQCDQVVASIQRLFPELHVDVVTIQTSGDRRQYGVTGAFVKEIQQGLLRGDIDLAVHSMKDRPVATVPGLVIAATPPRGPVNEMLVCRAGNADPWSGDAGVGAGGPRRSALVRHRYPQALCKPLQGNVDTRLRKLLDGAYTSILIAEAGLDRLGLLQEGSLPEALEAHRLPLDAFPPAPAQGALALECREEDQWMRELLHGLMHPSTWAEVTAERALLAALGGGCSIPLGAYAHAQGDGLKLNACVLSPDGSERIDVQSAGSVDEPELLGIDAAERLMALGAQDLLAHWGYGG